MKGKIFIFGFIFLFFFNTSHSKENGFIIRNGVVQIPDTLKSKLGSGYLQLEVSRKIRVKYILKKATPEELEPIWVNIYFKDYPTLDQIAIFENLGIECYLETWTPPLENHPYGFFLANLPAEQLINALSLNYVKRIDTAEKASSPQNNNAYKAIHADDVWTIGWNGTGVKVAILDSGLDTEPSNSDLPGTIEKKDYSGYPALDDDVENIFGLTGHGTHVTGTVLGRGVLSEGNTGNGGGAYKGMAPGADLVFLKIGNDINASASSSAIEAAMDAAINVYDADIITMSYGGWNTYHDGSESTEQKVDWCYSQGVPVFISAGNDANDGRHYSGTVGAGSQSGFIQVDVTGAGVNDTKLRFNLVWYDGLGTNNELTLKYYDSAQSELLDVTLGSTTESSRGTESQISYYNPYLPSGDGTYYLKVENTSGSSQAFHIYEDWYSGGYVEFNTPDPFYTISAPSSADYAMSVAAWTTRYSWIDYSGSGWTYGETEGDIASFSSRGPRVDGHQKPDIAAPGSVLISIRDRDVYTTPNVFWIDNDGPVGGDANYYVMQGTSMACPACAGAAALLLSRDSSLIPSEVYDSIRNNAATDGYTGVCPNNTWGYGKLDVEAAFPPTVRAELKIFLEGPYVTAGDSMSTALNDGDYLPTTSPYSEDPRTVTSIPDDITDWVLVQLRSTADGSPVASKSALLRKDGCIVADNGDTTNIVLDADIGDYFVVIKHRNHLTGMSTSSVALSNGSTTLYDFTTSSDQFYGTGGCQELETGVWGMYGSNANNSDQDIFASDLANIRTEILLGSYGYKLADANMDGNVFASDYALGRINMLAGVSSTVPNP